MPKPHQTYRVPRGDELLDREQAIELSSMAISSRVRKTPAIHISERAWSVTERPRLMDAKVMDGLWTLWRML